MKIIEELKLKETIEYIDRFEAKHQTLDKIYQNINDLNLFSLQAHNFEFDRSFFDEVSFVLSVIITIIKHPHISSFDIDEIIRSDLAGHIENDSFQMVFKDAKLWRDKDGEMVPEEVYYHEHIDEIKIYENIFIGMLINLIEQDLKKSLDFYISLLPILGLKKDLTTSEDVKYSINKIEKELKKIRFIKETYFYKQLKKCNLSNRKIIPTNILIKDRLYNYCFKFYKKFIRYEDTVSLSKDFTKYYLYLLLQAFKKRSASFTKEDQKTIFLSMKDFEIQIKLDEKNPVIDLNVYNGVEWTSSLLCLVEDNGERIDINRSNYETVTIWSLINNMGEKVNQMASKEKELINLWLDSKFIQSNIDMDIYSKYCPVCKSHSINIDEVNNVQVCTCTTCESKYVFTKPNVAWFMRVRGKK